MRGEMRNIKLVFLFMRNGAAVPGSYPDDWKPSNSCANYYHENFASEGYFYLLQKLMDNGVVSDLRVFYESNRDPGWANWVKHPNAHCMVVPELRLVEKYIDENTIIWVRGGFKHWHDLLTKYKGKNWLMLYAANTGRQRWKWWDVILDDISMQLDVDRYDRLWVPFIKPIDDKFFSPYDLPYKWDVCVGASHIHDKKGQWRIRYVIETLERMGRKNLRIIIPGATRRGTKTSPFIQWALDHGAVMPGHVHRRQLINIFSQSKVAAFLGAHGQNDRGPLEALSCGCPVIIGSPDYHTSVLSNMNGNYVRTLPGADAVNDYSRVAIHVNEMIDKADSATSAFDRRNVVSDEFQGCLGFRLAYQNMANLLLMISSFPPERKFKESSMRMLRQIKEGRCQ